MHNHDGEEQGIEPREGALEAGNKAPVEGEVKIACVVYLASVAVCIVRVVRGAINIRRISARALTPSVSENNMAPILGAERLGVLDRLPR
jgi:hypothetical protein